MAKKKTDAVVEEQANDIIDSNSQTDLDNQENESGDDTSEQENNDVDTVISEVTEGTQENKKDSDTSGAPKDKPATKKKTESEISDEAKAILSQYPNEQELYVDRWGGAFTKGTQPKLIKDAILYKNPYYNK